MGRRAGWTLIALGALLLVFAFGYQAMFSIGGNRSETCRERGSPPEVAASATPEAWLVEPVRSSWPIGVQCHWTDLTDGTTVVVGPGWRPTALAGSGLALAALSIPAFRPQDD